MQVDVLIEKLGLQPHPEGGFYRETYRSQETIPQTALPHRYREDRQIGTAIYYLLTKDTCSAMHRITSDEIFHFYLGDPVTMLQLEPEGKGKIVTLGSDILAAQLVQCIVPHDVWQGMFLKDGGSVALLGTTVAPGFDFSDFELGKRKYLLALYDEYTELIKRLTADDP
jgi:uncharacterized protein